MDLFQIVVGEGPLVVAAIHNGHYLRSEIADAISLTESDRLREEDPYTADLIDWAPTRLIGCRSRYEMDLNRPRDQAVYLTPGQAWGINVWRRQLAPDAVERSLANYDLFYNSAEALLRSLVKRHGRVIVLDVHTYNHRREGAEGALANPAENPEMFARPRPLGSSRKWSHH
jgi:N-formylglutamate deformylase